MNHSQAFATPNATSQSASLRWLNDMLRRNRGTGYLRQFDSPQDLDAFRAHVPVCEYHGLEPLLQRIQNGEADVMFSGLPVGYERTGGSTSGAKLIAYSSHGLFDFQRNVAPWLERLRCQFSITGRVYFSISPATREQEYIGAIPVGLSDTAYLGERWSRLFAGRLAVPLAAGAMKSVVDWTSVTLEHLKRADDLELISVWSPTFLLRLLDELPDPQEIWPRLKVVSCWASGNSARYAAQLAHRLPHATIQPKGLLSTEGVVSVPGPSGVPELVPYGWCEFEADGRVQTENELVMGEIYGVIMTTASGLYRYRTGDLVKYCGPGPTGRAMLEFIGRGSLVSDLAGEKLTEAFVDTCLAPIGGYCFLIPHALRPGYVLVADHEVSPDALQSIESSLARNPQYAYARRLDQLARLTICVRPDLAREVDQVQLARGTRLGDIKPLALRTDPCWQHLLLETE